MVQQTETLELLKAGRARIAKPENWCKNYYVRKVRPAKTFWKAQAQYCAVGAIREDGFNNPAFHNAWDALDVAAERMVMSYNDRPETTHADILAVYDKAIATLEAAA